MTIVIHFNFLSFELSSIKFIFLSDNSRLGISNQANSGILPTIASQVPRQVIFLNQNQAVSKPQPAVAVLNQTPLMMIPGGGGNLTNTAAQPHHKTSVIMSLKMSEK